MRLDQMLVDRGLAASRSRARDLILRGFVHVDGAVCVKPGQNVNPQDGIAISEHAPAYVSRGAEKLAYALERFAFDAAGRVALDVGASTGGFTEVLLLRGARTVYAVDVGHGQLHATLKGNPRVKCLEDQDARQLTPDLIEDPIEAIVADVSFISLQKVLPVPLSLAASGAWLVALIKPQFEVGPKLVGKGGIVRSGAARQAAVNAIEDFLNAQPHWSVRGTIVSPILGGEGNEEFLIGACRDV